MTEYTARRIKEMSPFELFTNLGLHRGQVGDHTMVRNPGTPRMQEHHFTYYHLGYADFIGVDDTFSRRVFHRSQHFTGKHFLEQCEAMRADAPWQGPAESPRWSQQTHNYYRANARFALDVLAGKISSKPKLQAKPKPRFKVKSEKQHIAHEDRPDVGGKPRLKLKSRAQQELFDKPKRFALRRS